jgi:hypothetical protein
MDRDLEDDDRISINENQMELKGITSLMEILRANYHYYPAVQDSIDCLASLR